MIYSLRNMRKRSIKDAEMSGSSVKTIGCTLAMLAISSCGPADDTGATPSRSVQANDSGVSVSHTRTGDTAILAAAESFEKLTEISFSASPQVLDATIIEVQSAAVGLDTTLTSDARSRLEERLSQIVTARANDNRADLAIAAVEGYRTLVSEIASFAKVPVAVSLLDYAGFRYDADLKAVPARWDDMAQAVAIGRAQWSSIAPLVTDTELRTRMDRTLQEMNQSVTSRNPSAAAEAVRRELAYVDELESFFNAK